MKVPETIIDLKCAFVNEEILEVSPGTVQLGIEKFYWLSEEYKMHYRKGKTLVVRFNWHDGRASLEFVENIRKDYGDIYDVQIPIGG